MAIDQELLEILACPACRGPLEILPGLPREDGAAQTQEADPAGLACEACGLVYPVRDSIPVMLKEEAIRRVEWDKKRG